MFDVKSNIDFKIKSSNEKFWPTDHLNSITISHTISADHLKIRVLKKLTHLLKLKLNKNKKLN